MDGFIDGYIKGHVLMDGKKYELWMRMIIDPDSLFLTRSSHLGPNLIFCPPLRLWVQIDFFPSLNFLVHYNSLHSSYQKLRIQMMLRIYLSSSIISLQLSSFNTTPTPKSFGFPSGKGGVKAFISMTPEQVLHQSNSTRLNYCIFRSPRGLPHILKLSQKQSGTSGQQPLSP